MGEVKHSGALAQIRRLCSLGLACEAVMPALLRSVRQLVPADSAGFFWVDDRGDLVNLYAERLLPPDQMRRYFERHYESPEHAFRERLKQQAVSGEFIGEINVDTTFETTRYFEEVLRPLGAYRILYTIVHDQGRPLGQLSLYRGKRDPRFTVAERGAVESASRYIAQCILGKQRQPAQPAPASSFRDSEQEALVVCSSSGEISAASYRAYALLSHASGQPINRSTMSGAVERAWRVLLKKLAGELRAVGAIPDAPPQLTVENVWGRFRLRAYALGQFEMGVLVQRQEHLLIRITDAMRGLPLSAQQKEVALLLARGLTNSEIGSAMGVSINTASYHIKQLFHKLDAHDRAQAIASILDGHTARR
jgi:DNA-binding CsgD family transcriptional regulator